MIKSKWFFLTVIFLTMPVTLQSLAGQPQQSQQQSERPEALAMTWFERWNALDGSEEKTAAFLDLYQPDAIHEVNSNERKVGSVYLKGSAAIGKMAEDFGRANTEILFFVEKAGTVPNPKKTERIYTMAEGPWGGPGAAVQFIAYYRERESNKSLQYSGAAFFEFVNGKIHHVRFHTNRDDVSEITYSLDIVKRVPTVDDLLKVETVGGARISTDGKWVAYTVTSTDFNQDAFVTQLWVDEVATGKKLQLTDGPTSSGNARWSPDSQWLAFTRNRQIFITRPTGGEAVALTKSATGVRDFEWSPDGKTIAYIASDAPSQASKERDARYGQYEVVRQEHSYSHIWTLNVAEARNSAGAGVQRTKGKDFSVDMFSWSPDSTRIAFSARAHDGPGYSKQGTSDIYLLNTTDNVVKKMVSLDGADANPRWSPDGRSIVFTSVLGNTKTAVNSRLAVMKVDGSEKPRSITDEFDEDPSFVAWTADGIYFSALQKTASHLFRVNPAGGAITRITSPDNLMAGGFSLAADGQTMAFTAASPWALTEVFVSKVRKFAPRTITNMTEQVGEWKFGTREVISWKSQDGTTIEGVLIKPPNFDPTKKYPLLCEIHQGPTGIDRPALLPGNDTRYYPVDIFAARGALILKPNYRGSIGYGEAFRRLNIKNMGVGDAWDVISGVDYLISQGFVDPQKVGCMGWSQGGYITSFLTAASDRFVAISAGAGVTDWTDYYYTSDDTDFTVDYLGGTPMSDPEVYRKTSPISYVKKGTTKTPTLIQHGELDVRDPVSAAYQLRQALQDIGVKVEFVEFKGLPHGLGKPKAHRLAMEQNLLWFNHYIWGDKEPDFTNMARPQQGTPEAEQ